MKSVSFKWVEGYVVVSLGGSQLEIKCSNAVISMSQREIIIKGVYQGYREYPLDSRRERKVVYIDFAFPLRGVEKPEGPVYIRDSDISLGPFGISYTNLGSIGSYITVYPPPGSLYDYMTISPHMIALFSIGRRQLYYMEDEGYKRFILV